MGSSYSSSRIPPRSPSDSTDNFKPICRLQPHGLPPELLLLILEEAYCNSSTSYSARRAGLCTAATVCRAWLHPAQQLLWRSVEIKSLRQLKALRSTCETNSRGAELAAYPRSLAIWNPVGDPPDDPPKVRDIAVLLQRLPRLAELRLDRPQSALTPLILFDLELATLRRKDAPPLTTLRISYAPPALVHTLLRALPTLRFVEVAGCRSGDSDSPDAPVQSSPPHPRCKLYELRWGYESHLHAPHALRASSDTLRILALHSLPPAPTLPALLPPRLRSLRVFRYHPALPSAVRHCDALEEFVMQDHVPPAALLAALPRSLEHLALDCDDGNQQGLAAVAAWLRTGEYVRLRVLTCFSPDVRDADWPGLVSACRSARVELRCFKGWHGLYGNECEALGEVARFPRAVPHHAQRILVVPITPDTDD